MRLFRWLGPTLVAVLLLGAAAAAQRQLFRTGMEQYYEQSVKNAKYDGRFAFARLKYTSEPQGFYYCGMPPWGHGYFPSCRGGGERAETSLMKIMNELTFLDPHIEDSVVLTVDSPELAKYPIAYMTEPGFWTITDKEAAALRAYLLKGGFLIVDDFRAYPRDHGGGGWENFESVMERVIPSAQFVDLDEDHPIFTNAFFKLESLNVFPQSYDTGRPIIRGLFEDNDPKKRLLVVANFNTDISDFWEFSATGFKPVDESNQAYKLGVNYLMYGLTH